MDTKVYKKYNNKASLYSTYRPSYPKQVIEYLNKDFGLHLYNTIADIGAGTGIFTDPSYKMAIRYML